jgi:hypothetical protein
MDVKKLGSSNIDGGDIILCSTIENSFVVPGNVTNRIAI